MPRLRFLLLGFLIAAAGCLQREPAPQARAEHEAGRTVYNARCYFCHGYSGNARTVAAATLRPAPRDFTAASPGELSVERIERAVREGVPGSAMASFSATLSADEIRRVAAFVHREFVVDKAENTRYHTPENGWPDHARYADAFAFVTGALSADAPWESLTPSQARGKKLYLEACVTCHVRADPARDAVTWESRAVSYPPNRASCLSCHNRERIGTVEDGGDPHSLHDRAPALAGLSALQARGERLFQANCAFCHAADGTGRNWIGAFLEPHPADFTSPDFARRMTRGALRARIAEGKPDASMPAWRTVLAPAEIDAVAAYIERAFSGPLR
jgi:mono/diheme cytochrome c family protein